MQGALYSCDGARSIPHHNPSRQTFFSRSANALLSEDVEVLAQAGLCIQEHRPQMRMMANADGRGKGKEKEREKAKAITVYSRQSLHL
eukprot:3060742-Amphidinium_carterae.1